MSMSIRMMVPRSPVSGPRWRVLRTAENGPTMTDRSDSPSDPVADSSAEASGGLEGNLALLMERCAAGDEEAFATVYDATSRLCFGLAMRILRDETAAEEVTHDAYLHLWAHSRRYDSAAGSAVAWIAQLVHRRAVARLRLGLTRFAAPQAGDGADAVPARARAAAELAYFGGRTWCEVAREEHIAPDAAAVRIRDGLLEL